MNDYEIFLKILRKEIVPAIGCTEPIAVAYAVSVAKEQIKGHFESLIIFVDLNIYKNGLRVAIPGTTDKGLKIAAALGFIAGNSKKGFKVIEGINEKKLEEARLLVIQKKINISIKEDCKRLFIEVILRTDKGKARVIIIDKHLNIVNIEKMEKGKFKPFIIEEKKPILSKSNIIIQKYDLSDFLKFANIVKLNEINFLENGVEMNVKIANEGLALKSGVGKGLKEMIKEGLVSDDIISRAQLLCAAASETRMSGSKLPVMSSAGSGNHGITIFLTNFAVAEKMSFCKEKLLRALSLSNIITIYIKSFTGTLSAMCGCGVAAGVGASAGIAYLFGGNIDQIFGAMLNMIGSISGIICDGAKEGCVYKLVLASGCAVRSALFSMKGIIINTNDGILAADFKQLIKNLGYVCNPGMISTNKAILNIMLNKKYKK